ncbi:hypothetical protein [Xanthomonas citri]|uniref:hypothetical protein n=1 Tax=Xanthomonas citri TaxID=346 RepID=UPI000C1775EC|nr:hypothetical protein [Xanthomonas citri]ATS54074.1 hypothetical protein XcfCFBP6994P_01895 [Xanthomonas citri pv. phaseoli var. fuscans]SOO32786.1 hypothetical protein XFF6994_2350004 [Xanthomonas citri pv. fuscans]
MRETATCFTIAENGEHGRFYLTEGTEPDGRGGTTYWCVLVCHTTFGTVGHTWNSMGRPAAQFLAKIGKDYLLDKLWGLDSDVYDEDTGRAGLAGLIFEQRRQNGWGRDAARTAFDELIETELSSREQFFALAYGSTFFPLCVDGGPTHTVANPQAVGFWEQLWPAFIAELTTGVEACHA